MTKKTVRSDDGRPVSLKVLGEYLDLSPATISLVMNNAPGAKSIAPATRERVLAAAKKFNYRPNTIARSLRTRQTFTIGVIVPEFSEGYFTMVMNGVEEYLMHAGYLHFVVSHQGKSDLIDEYPRLLSERSVDGFILVNTSLNEQVRVPVVAISGHRKMQNVTNVMLDHDRSAALALKHLYDLGHRRIAFMKGQRHALDSEYRWEGIQQIAKKIGITVFPELCVFLEANSWSPELGYPVVRDLLAKTRDFTAIFCFNDIAAVGAIRAITDAGLSCPNDISVIGFDDIASAMYQTPSLTTIRQPLRRMGETAAQLLLKRIQNPLEAYPETVVFEPELMVRESTSGVRILAETVKRKAKR
ncbi:LacI family DNA-binding transcriptional regulator [Granulicella arctica]|uniref:LacI family transcriptional regulator n=1 Tax=Granulicella arctica TaxID=940613 RepID=A0A7Y9PHM1_9BACT|nr:LacI family DNA-binding transcriptional regulator [Granulicella arctica]NYF80063.1 LacI family transcriptional regulator [Granulicella arctica]